MLHEKNDNPITFPNYMNWYNQGDEKASGRQIPPKKTSAQEKHGQEGQKMDYYLAEKDMHQRYQPSYEHTKSRHDEAVATQPVHEQVDQNVFKAATVDHKREQKLNRLRQELQEYQEYQFRRPFQANNLPSDWTNNRQEVKVARSKGRSQFHFEEATAEPKEFRENRHSTPVSETRPAKTPVPKRGHLNRGLQSIMADEPGVSFNKPGNHNKTGHYSYFPGKDSHSTTSPYLKKKQAQSNQGNGEFNEHE